ncbi:MAG: RimK family alpha-L-glutamate ligase [Methylococcales bacterium]|nr:RimK family alpha-L-glutamate ligase [Methylococcales bacterium]MDD5755241.1 RimK family alpha-L-glutamate ligase [Methylococcales bacterium]
MPKIAIFTDDAGWHGKQLQHAFKNLGYDSVFVSLTECRFNLKDQALPLFIPEFETELPIAVFVRGVPGGSLEEVVLYLDFLHALKIMGIPVYNNASAIERSVDKAMTSFLLHHAGLETPSTWVLRDRNTALDVVKNELSQGHFVISKPLFGSQGEGIRRIEKMTDLPWLTSSHGVYYLQHFVLCAGEGFSDYRVFVINNKVVATMRRRGKSWLNNVAKGATCERIEPTVEMIALAIQATKLLNMDYAGVDILEDSTGKLNVIEINSVPAWKGLESVCDITIAELLAQDLVNRYLT